MEESNPPLSLADVRRIIEPLYEGQVLFTGEPVMSHAEGVVDILCGIRDDDDLLAAGYLFFVWDQLKNPKEWLTKHFGRHVCELVTNLKVVLDVSEKARSREGEAKISEQPEAVRRLLLALCQDLRVVLLRLASRLQTLRYFAATKAPGAEEYGAETLALYSPLANRLGIWQMKWELEDLSLRFTKPKEFAQIAVALEETREERVASIQEAVKRIQKLLVKNGIQASVSGRPKHIYSIWKKMCKKNLKFEQLYDVRAVRIIVDSVEKCYETLSLIQENSEVLSKEFDDYIAKPKPNGYQSLHTVVVGSQGKPLEIQIRTRAMHEFAELGVAAHWRYKEGSKRKAGENEEDRVAWLRQMLAWKSDVQQTPTPDKLKDEHIYVLTPQGKVLDLIAGSTPIDFAYHLHTELGHRCRGAKVDGVMVPLNTKLQSGQTVEIITVKVGAPSRDWLNPELGFVASPRSRTKVRQWFNAQEMEQAITAGREKIDKDLARLGKTAVKLEELAKKLGFDSVDELCLAAGKDELGQKAIENVLAPRVEEKQEETVATTKKTAHHDKGKVLVVGVDSLLTQLARCCHPVPPDPIVGFVTRGRGVTVHRADCPNIRNLDDEGHDRLIEVSWTTDTDVSYPVEILIIAIERVGLLRDISEVFSKEKQPVVAMNSSRNKGDLHFNFTIEIKNSEDLKRTLNALREIKNVVSARRK
ncbi:RelA/SpoT family protein [Turicimonas muris]|uniref:RelA/SpoT family protein n=1 Tax=Turicimonas muris TaxID=1796652 RepID=UPI002676CCE7|nr:bifunctional (p)ppGpp synthetase/guanosine-3',5'-bis(diphosphate) 3'-pyrophosphohydrolase [Turicimonas muris]